LSDADYLEIQREAQRRGLGQVTVDSAMTRGQNHAEYVRGEFWKFTQVKADPSVPSAPTPENMRRVGEIDFPFEVIDKAVRQQVAALRKVHGSLFGINVESLADAVVSLIRNPDESYLGSRILAGLMEFGRTNDTGLPFVVESFRGK
jgi:hypothetical protein